MPSTYAHYTFGKQMMEQFPAEWEGLIRERWDIYAIGLHGPDILFYYHPLKANSVSQIGFGMHDRPAREFFAHAKQICLAASDGESALAYALGFVCHFALDSTCHGYIEKKIEVSKLAHSRIESEFDRMLLERSGVAPLSADLTSHIRATRESAAVIAPFFASVTEAQVLTALRSMRRCSAFLQAAHAPKRLFVKAILRFSKNYREKSGMMIAKRPVRECADSNLRLEKLMRSAQAKCLALAKNFVDFVRGEAQLDAAFDRTFGPDGDWRAIPVFTEEDERKYSV